MFHYFGTVTNTKGDSLADWQVECVLLSDGTTVVDIYSDENSTPILGTSGVANRAVSDSEGNYDFYVTEGTYSLRFYDSSGTYQKTQRFLPMYGQLNQQLGANVTDSAATTYTLATTNKGNQIQFTSSTAVTVTVPAGLGSDFICSIIQGGTGQVTLTAGAGATLVNADSQFKTQAQYVRLAVIALGSDTLMVEGRTAA